MATIPYNGPVSRLRDAGDFRLQMQRWTDDDILEKKEGWIVHRGVDPDVLVWYSDPSRNSTYCRVFADEQDEASSALGYFLSQLLFSHYAPLLILPPAQEELARVYHAIYISALQEANEALQAIEQLRTVFGGLDANKQVDLKRYLVSKEGMPLLKHLYGGTGPNESIKRLAPLFVNERVLRSEAYAYGSPLQSLPEPKPADKEVITTFSVGWQKKLAGALKEMGHKRRGENIITDAEVLARLQWTNNNIESRRERLILVSGDEHIERAAQGVKLESGKSFAAVYVRHPKAFFADPQIYEYAGIGDALSEGENLRSLAEWLDVSFTFMEPERDDYLGRLRSFVRRGKDISDIELQSVVPHRWRDNAFLTFRDRWEKFVKVVAWYVGVKTIEEKVESLVKEFGSKNIVDMQRIEDEIWRILEETYESFALSSTHAGLTLTLSKEEQRRCARGLPALRLERFPTARRFSQFLTNSLSHSYFLSEDVKGEPREWLQKLEEEDESRYTVFLVHALAFAAALYWHKAESLARVAATIADRERAKSIDACQALGKLKGDEATFLLAYIARVSASKRDDLERARELLREARKRAEMDVARPEAGQNDIRFRSEKISQDVSEWGFCLFSDGEVLPEPECSLLQCQHDCEELLLAIERDGENEMVVREFVERQTFGNYFLVALLRRCIRNDRIELDDNGKRWLARCEQTISDSDANCPPISFDAEVPPRRVTVLFRIIVIAARRCLDMRGETIGADGLFTGCFRDIALCKEERRGGVYYKRLFAFLEQALKGNNKCP